MADNRDRLSILVAEKLNIPTTKVVEVLRSQHLLFKEVMKSKKPKTLYLRKVGFFIHKDVRYNLRAEKIKRVQQQSNNPIEEEEEEVFPLEFKDEE